MRENKKTGYKGGVLPMTQRVGILSSQTAMRLTLWFILILAFSVGMCCAVVMKTYVFEAKPPAAQNPEATTKILVAKRTIPAGINITADSVVFQEVAVSEVPLGSLTSFDQVFRRQPAYPIPVGCPICEDLLAPFTETEAQPAFLPAGSQFVTLDVARIRQGGKVVSSSEPLAAVLAADQRIDIRVVPREAVTGTFAERKNEVLRTFVTENYRESGELLLKDVPIHQVQKQSIDGQTVTPQVMLVLDKSEASLLTEASKKGQIRILLAADSNAKSGTESDNSVEPLEIDNIAGVEMAVSTSPNIPAVSIPVETAPLEVPLVSELSASAAAELVPTESITSISPDSISSETLEKTAPEPKSPDIFASDVIGSDVAGKDLPPAPLPELAYSALKVEKRENTVPSPPAEDASLADNPAAPTVPEMVIKEKIRNDPPVIAFGTPAIKVISDRSAEQKPMHAASLPNEVLQSSEWKPESSIPTYSETVSEYPRISQSLPFQTPSTVAPTNEFPKEAKQWTESAVVPKEMFSPIPVSPMPVSLKPTISPIPNIVQEKVPSYSPFERRVYTISPVGELEESYDVLPAPALIQKNTD